MTVQTIHPTKTENTAIYYFSDGFDTSREKLMGRHVAGEEFLKAWAAYSNLDEFYCYARSQQELQHCLARISGLGSTNRKNVWIPWDNWTELSRAGCLFMPGPILGPLAYQRRSFADAAFSLCGITHTTASDRIMDGIGELLIAPTQPWDAVICTSHAVKSVVVTLLESQSEYLRERFSLPLLPQSQVQLPVIPLGVNYNAFALAPEHKAQVRQRVRSALGIADDTMVVLYFGRLSFHAKAHPMPTFRALEAAAHTTGKSVCCIMVGRFANDATQRQYVESAKTFAPSVKTVFIDGRNPEACKYIWFAADVFTSMSDNIQESFGLTPLEAMAAGLPVIVSDWDGYRDTVRHGVDGFLIPTWMPPSGSAADIALLYASGRITYDAYIGCYSQFTSVDIPACVRAFVTLIENEHLRKQLGTAGQERVKNVFDWKHIIQEYKNLFQHLAELRQGSNREKLQRTAGGAAHPLRQDATVLFHRYPSMHISAETIIEANEFSNEQNLAQVLAQQMNSFAIERVAQLQDLKALIDHINKGPISVGALCRSVGSRSETAAIRSILWLHKMGLLNIVAAQEEVY